MRNKRTIAKVRCFLLAQISVTAVLGIGFLVFSSMQAALSSVLGGLVCVVPNAYFAKKFFRHSGAHKAQQIVRSFYLGETVKILLTIALFAVFFKYIAIVPLVFFASFIVVQLSFWTAPLFLR